MQMVTPLRTETYEHMQLNAGVFLYDFDYSDCDDATELREAIAEAIEAGTGVLGATRGGGTFVVTREMREPDVDGKRYSFKGGRFADSMDAYLGGTLVEIHPEVMEKIIAGGESTTSGNITTVKAHTAIDGADYIDELVWVGDRSDGGLIMISLKNALNTNGLTLTFTDKGEGTMPFEFHAHQDAVEDYNKAPFKVLFFDKATSGISGSGTNSGSGTGTGTGG